MNNITAREQMHNLVPLMNALNRHPQSLILLQ